MFISQALKKHFMHDLHTRKYPVLSWAEFCQYLVKFCFITPKKVTFPKLINNYEKEGL